MNRRSFLGSLGALVVFPLPDLSGRFVTLASLDEMLQAVYSDEIPAHPLTPCPLWSLLPKSRGFS